MRSRRRTTCPPREFTLARSIVLATVWVPALVACSGGVGAPSGSGLGSASAGAAPGTAPVATSVAPGQSGDPFGTQDGLTASAGAPNVASPGETGVASPGETGVASPAAGAPVDDGLPGRSLVRRLSNAEYAATIRTLFGDDTDVTASFPEDTVVNGFTNNTDVQDVGPALAEQYVAAAEAISARARADLDSLLGCPLADGSACVADFIARFGKRAWRRPLASTEQAELSALFASEADPATGVELVLQALLTSPSFLYRAEVGIPVAGQPYRALTSWEIASRLSYFLTGTMPDDALFAAAEADALTTTDAIETQARRLLASPEARENVASFFTGWLNLFAVDRLQRDATQFPAWSSQLPPLFYEETRAFATRVVFDGEGDLPTLFTASFSYGDPALAAYYGGTAGAAQDGIARIDLPPTQRAGLLTQASFLATHAKEIQTDPVARGKFVRERLLCQGIPAPPPDLMITAPEITPGSTTRERFAQHEEVPSCAACHVLIDPVGLAFEHYDAIGQWRDQEQGLDIDASGDLTATDVTGPLDGVVDMAHKLAQSDMASECFVRYWFRFAFGRGESDSEDARIDTIAGQFRDAEQSVQELLVALTLTPDFRYLAEETTP